MSSVIIPLDEEERIRQMYLYFEKWAMDRVSQEAYLRKQVEEVAEEWKKVANERQKAAEEWEKIANAWKKITERLEEKLTASAVRFLQLGLSIEEISDITGLPVEEIKKLQG